ECKLGYQTPSRHPLVTLPSPPLRVDRDSRPGPQHHLARSTVASCEITSRTRAMPDTNTGRRRWAPSQLIPVRMLNEYAYCPRLFRLMYVDGRWGDNVYTEEGHEVHRRVDRLDHVLPDPGSAARAAAADDDDDAPTV